jgi:pimeloyl-ACP methyl ester carboxylesterase
MKPKKRIILVHGTFAKTKEGWTSLEGGFLAKIHKALYYIHAFGWSGTNSHYARQSASVRLMEFLSDLSNSSESIHLIGHSHGGTVIQFALENHSTLKRKNTWKEKVKSWTTVGTPFFKFSGTSRYFSAKSLYAISLLIATLIIYSICFILAKGSMQNSYELIRFHYWKVVFIFFILAGVIYQFFTAITFNSNLEHTFKEFGKKWLGIYSRYDEAILTLKNSQSLHLELSKREFPSEGVSINFLFFTRLVFNTIYDFTIRVFLSKLLNKNLKNFITGLDRSYYSVEEVNYNPINEEPFFIPKELDDRMLREVIADNQNKIEYIRKALNSENKNLIESIMKSKETDKPKLIHSIYFDQDEIVKFILEHILIEEGIAINETDWMKTVKEVRKS